jgi:hypothetical protein
MSYEMRNTVLIRNLQEKRPDCKWKSNPGTCLGGVRCKPQDNWSSGIDSCCICPKLKTG